MGSWAGLRVTNRQVAVCFVAAYAAAMGCSSKTVAPQRTPAVATPSPAGVSAAPALASAPSPSTSVRQPAVRAAPKFTTEQLRWARVASVEAQPLAEPRVWALKARTVLVAGRHVLELGEREAKATKRFVHGLPGTRKRHDWAIAGMFGEWESSAWIHLVFSDGTHTSSSLFRWRGWWVRILGPGDAGAGTPYVDRRLDIVGTWPDGGVLGAYTQDAATAEWVDGYGVMGAHFGPVHPAKLHLGSQTCSSGYRAGELALQGKRLVGIGQACGSSGDAILRLEPGDSKAGLTALPKLQGRELSPTTMDVDDRIVTVVGKVAGGAEHRGFIAEFIGDDVRVVETPVKDPLDVLHATDATWIVERDALWRVAPSGTVRYSAGPLKLRRLVRGHDRTRWLEATDADGVVILRAPAA